MKALHRLWIPLSYVALSIIMTWPLVAELGRQVPTDVGSDVRAHEWTLWWLKQALLAGQNPFFTSLLGYPAGTSLTTHNIPWANFALWLPIYLAANANVAHSLSYLIIFAFNAYAMYLFALEQTGAQPAAFVAGLIFGFLPNTLSDVGHINLLFVGWLPLSLLYLDRTLRRGTLREGALAGLFLALMGITRWQLLLLGMMVAGLFVVYRMATDRHARRPAVWKALAGTGIIAVLAMAPFALPVIIAELTRAGGDELLTYEPAFSADLLGYIIPHGGLALWRWLTERLPARLHWPQAEVHFLGFTALTLAALGVATRWRAARYWLLLSIISVILALGPAITVGQQALDGIPTPYRLIEDTFFNQIIRKPWRYNTFLGLPLAMMAALGFAWLQAQWRVQGARALALVVGLLILAEYWLAPYPLAAAPIPAWYGQLARDPDHFGILTLPIGPRLADKFSMLYQTVHHKPLVGGHVSRPPGGFFDYMDTSPFLDDMLYRREMNPALVDVTHQLAYLADANVRYVVMQKQFLRPDQIEQWQDWLTFAPRYEDDTLAVYATSPEAGVDFTVAHPLTDALGLIRAGYEPAQVEQGSPLTVDLRWAANAAAPGDYAHCIHLLDAGGEVVQTAKGAISPDWPTSRWQANEVARDVHTFRVDPHLSPGVYDLQVTLCTGEDGAAAGAPLNLGPVEITALPRTFELPQPAHATATQFGDAIRLHGYDLSLADSTLSLTLHWQARERMDRSYKVFVHVVDAASGAMLAQYDAAPRNWAYPTPWWEAGEVVSETIELPLGDAGLSNAVLSLGLYDEATGERLPIASPAGPETDALTIPLPGSF